MKKVYLVVSVLLFIGFLILFMMNILEGFDIFYVAWSTIAFPILIVLLRKETKYNEFILVGLLVLGGLYLLDTYVFVTQQDPYGMPVAEPGPTILGVSISLIGLLILLLSYTLMIVDFKQYDKVQYVIYGTMIALFLGSIAVFLKNTFLEYTLGIMLFFTITLNFARIFYQRVKGIKCIERL